MADGAEAQQQQSAPALQTRVDIWSTDAVQGRERFAYWRDAVCRAVFGISIEAPPEHFSARIAARSAGPLRFAISDTTGYELVRSARDIDSAPSDHYSIYLQLSGRSLSTLHDQPLCLGPNDVAFYDGTKPIRAVHSGRRAIAVVPRPMIDLRAPWLRRRKPHKLPASPYLNLARRHLLQLSAPDASLSETEAILLTENLCNLVALASASGIETSRLEPDLQIQAILVFCRQNLHDPDLSPQRVADRFRMSVRTLHARFSQIGQTFGRWLLEARLEACGAALRDVHQCNLNISEIAYRMGFNDLSHFNKAFRARFGMTPRDWRNAGAPN